MAKGAESFLLFDDSESLVAEYELCISVGDLKYFVDWDIEEAYGKDAERSGDGKQTFFNYIVAVKMDIKESRPVPYEERKCRKDMWCVKYV
jgi:hypothetical protein